RSGSNRCRKADRRRSAYKKLGPTGSRRAHSSLCLEDSAMDQDREADEMASAHASRCCVVGAGPAGAVLGLLLARAGVPVTLLESPPDSDRDSRGDTVHPPTLELLAQLGLADRLHALPHGKIRDLRLRTRTRTFTLGDLGRLRTPYPYVMMLPQAKLLELL